MESRGSSVHFHTYLAAMVTDKWKNMINKWTDLFDEYEDDESSFVRSITGFLLNVISSGKKGDTLIKVNLTIIIIHIK